LPPFGIDFILIFLYQSFKKFGLPCVMPGIRIAIWKIAFLFILLIGDFSDPSLRLTTAVTLHGPQEKPNGLKHFSETFFLEENR